MVTERIYGLTGHPLGHSFSPSFFNSKFHNEGIAARYELFDLHSIAELPPLIAGNTQLAGLNVTIPYKEEVIPLLDNLTPEAREIGAVNCIRIERQEDGTPILTGTNTDVTGCRDSLRPLLEECGWIAGLQTRPLLQDESVSPALILGTGGGAKGAAAALRQLGFHALLLSRTAGKGNLTYSDLDPEMVWRAPVIINATPAGMSPHPMSAPPFPFQYLRGDKGVGTRQAAFDLVYNPDPTLFMRICSAHGLATLSGLRMLYLQAEASWLFWNEAIPLQ